MKCYSLTLVAAPFLATLPFSNDSPLPEVVEIGVSERLREVVRAHDAGETQTALSELAGLMNVVDELPDARRAEVHFARGIVLVETLEGEERLPATEDFFSARAFAGPGELRHAATYDAGLVHLLEGERWRSQIPEVGGANGMAPHGGGAPLGVPGMPQAGAGQSPPGDEEEPPDPLAEARAAYLQAREILCERLRVDWRDADTRANLELIQRRLKELDEIERQREEQEQQEDQDQEGEDGEESENEDGEEQENEEQDGDSEEEQDSQDGDQESEDEQEPGEQEQQESEDGESEEGEGEEEPIEAPQPEEGEEQEPQAGEPQETERHLTREEVMRLLDQLAEIEEEARAQEVRAARARRENVEKDW